jgi:hypothetical protein
MSVWQLAALSVSYSILHTWNVVIEWVFFGLQIDKIIDSVFRCGYFCDNSRCGIDGANKAMVNYRLTLLTSQRTTQGRTQEKETTSGCSTAFNKIIFYYLCIINEIIVVQHTASCLHYKRKIQGKKCQRAAVTSSVIDAELRRKLAGGCLQNQAIWLFVFVMHSW